MNCLKRNCVPSPEMMPQAAAIYPAAGLRAIRVLLECSSLVCEWIFCSGPLFAAALFLRQSWRSLCGLGGRRLDKMKSPDDEIADPDSQVASLKCHSPTVFNCRHISCNNLLESSTVWCVCLASYSLTPASSHVVSPLSVRRTFITLSHIASSSSDLFSLQTEHSSTYFITLLSLLTILPLSEHMPVNTEKQDWKQFYSSQLSKHF